jgi:hypothetical protein
MYEQLKQTKKAIKTGVREYARQYISGELDPEL